MKLYSIKILKQTSHNFEVPTCNLINNYVQHNLCFDVAISTVEYFES